MPKTFTSIPVLALLVSAWGLGARAHGSDEPATVREIVSRVEASRLGADVDHLASYGTRHTHSKQINEAGAWIHARFRSLGYQVEYHEFELNGKTCKNVVASRRGTTEPETWLVLGAHYDSRAKNIGDPGAKAPGADDNASGTSGLLELARVLSEVETACSIRLIAFSGEEQGLKGSTAYARKAAAEKLKIRLMVNMDMIGHPTDPERLEVVVENDSGNRRPENDAPSLAFAERMRKAAAAFTGLKTTPGPLYASDYMPFEAEGFPCVGVFDGADKKPFYHTDEDAPEIVDAQYAAEVVRMVLATTLEIAAQP